MAAPTPYSFRQYQGDGVTRTYSIPFPYLKREDVRVFVDGTRQVEGVDYSWTSDTQIDLTNPTDKVVEARRFSPEDLQLVQWLDGSYIIQDDLNRSDLQWLYLIQEHSDELQELFDQGHHVREASETVKGIVRLATKAETASGTSSLLAVHPAGLRAEIERLEALMALMEDQIRSKAPLNSPALTGTPTAPTAAPGTNSTQLATTEFVQAATASVTITDASETVAGKVELATAAETTTGTDNTRAVHPAGLKVELDKKASLASPALTGTPTAPTATAGTNTDQIATTAFVESAVLASGGTGGPIPDATEAGKGLVELATAAETTTGTDNTRAVHPAGLKVELNKKANLASPNFTGTPTAPTASQATNNTQLATTEFVQGGLAGKAPLNSPALTGTPTAPTANAGTNSTQLATTAFVNAAVAAGGGGGGGSVADASESAKGIVQLATAAETTAGTDGTKAVHPAGLKVELDKKASLASPALTGTPTAPTAATNTNTTQIATTAFVKANYPPAANELFAGVVELATTAEVTAGTDTTRVVTPAGLKAALDSQTVTVPDGSTTVKGIVKLANNTESLTGTSDQIAATPAGVITAINDRIKAGTQSVAGLVRIATTSEISAGSANSIAVQPAGLKSLLDTNYAKLASPGLTGTPTAPTAAAGTATTQLATTAFVDAAVNKGMITFGTEKNATGAEVEFTGIPATARQIMITFTEVSTNGTSAVGVVVGSGTYATTGYKGGAMGWAAQDTGALNDSTYFAIGYGTQVSTAAAMRNGAMTLTRSHGNTWVMTSIIHQSQAGVGSLAAGTITLAGSLDRIKILAGGTTQFDNGVVNVGWL
jgi:hypothetical protein